MKKCVSHDELGANLEPETEPATDYGATRRGQFIYILC